MSAEVSKILNDLERLYKLNQISLEEFKRAAIIAIEADEMRRTRTK